MSARSRRRSPPAPPIPRHLHIPVRRLYGIPSALAILSGGGLISALLADGFWDGVSWVALSIPAAAAIWFVLRPAGSHVPSRFK
ncbi:MAG: hypothetical protein ABL860_04320 [Candidatus Nitrotoga sp.]